MISSRALEAGAALAVVARAARRIRADAPLLRGRDVLAGLVDLARAARARSARR
jgi:UDP-N-acetylmuramoyl-tripeptide--D-alanyl-D-alanine ligase